MNDIDWSKLPTSSPEAEWHMTELCINDSVSMVTRVLSAIKKWEEIALAEFEEWKKDFEKRDKGLLQRMADYGQDPISEEGILSAYTEYALYGSLAVNIAAMVEKQLQYLLPVSNARPQFGDHMQKLETKCGCKREDVKHFGNHMFVRELANRFKHSGGDATKDFVEKYGPIAGIEHEGERILYSQYCWEYYIQQAKELLIDVAKRIASNTEKEGN